MRHAEVTFPELALIAGTRAGLGFGLGLLVADRWSREQRRAIGWTLVMVGIVSTVPLAYEVLGRLGRSARAGIPAPGRGAARRRLARVANGPEDEEFGPGA